VPADKLQSHISKSDLGAVLRGNADQAVHIIINANQISRRMLDELVKLS
jgi:hypothetical protein